jgi:hypothetical protein
VCSKRPTADTNTVEYILSPTTEQDLHSDFIHKLKLSTSTCSSRKISSASSSPLLIPLYVRSTSIPHIVFHSFIVAVLTFIITILTARKFRPVVAAAAAVAVVWSWCANHIANYAWMGEWKRIIFGYAVAYEALYRLLPVKINIYQWILDEFVEEYTNMLRNQNEAGRTDDESSDYSCVEHSVAQCITCN